MVSTCTAISPLPTSYQSIYQRQIKYARKRFKCKGQRPNAKTHKVPPRM
jgi:hypothetical protein